MDIRIVAKLSGKNAKSKINISESAESFVKLMNKLRFYMGAENISRPLTNITFFVGAGFSKSWDARSPTGSELFTLESDVVEQVADTSALQRMFGLNSIAGIGSDQLRQIVYQIDMYERYPEIRSRYVDEQNIRLLRGALRAAVVDRYEKIAEINYFDDSAEKFPLHNPTPKQMSIIRFFRNLHNMSDGSQDVVEGVRSNFITTNYDYVIETILDRVLGDDDTMFLYNYRGFTPISFVNQPNLRPVHDHWLVSQLLKINGGFEILRRGGDYILDYRRRETEEVMRDPPVLMLASREQDYSDPYFRTIFPKAVRLLRESKVLVLVGYSLPEDDALIRFILRQFAEEAEDGVGKFIFYISPGDSHKKRSTLEQVFPSIAAVGFPRVVIYDGGFDAFVEECLVLMDGGA